MTLRDDITDSVRSLDFEERIYKFKQTLCDAADRLSPEELLRRYERGEKEHGVITEEAFAKMDPKAMLEEEVADAFWYYVFSSLKP